MQQLLYFFFILLVNSIVSLQAYNSCGEKCDINNSCNTTLSLKCLNGTCQCYHPETMIFQEDGCVSLIGTNCYFPDFTPKCVSSAECIRGICSCASQQFSKDNAKCHRMGAFGSPCKESEECRQQYTCRNGTCSCPQPQDVYIDQSYHDTQRRNVLAGTCVSGHGRPCDITTDELLKRKLCVKNAACIEGVCNCLPDHKPRKDGLCGRPFDSSCLLKGDVCDESLKCFDRRCACRSPKYQRGYPSEFTCRGLVGLPCDELNACVLGSECLNKGAETVGSRCTCKEGYTQGEDFACYLAHGESCKSEGVYPYEKCDPLAKLLCEEGKCKCRNHFDQYVASRRTCAAPHWYPCKLDEDCLPGAVCKVEENGGIVGRCQPTSTKTE